ncbi:MAG: ComF family protein [Paludibacteraceae bacterium]|nr:ComF family protein [Paludibacteraceae bacterium]
MKCVVVDRHCLNCGAALEIDEIAVCKNCEATTLKDLFASPMLKYKDNVVEQRLMGLTPFETAASLMPFEINTLSQRLIHDLKYNNYQDISKLFGKAIAENIRQNNRYTQIDYIIPLPLHPKRVKKRGYNQSELIATEVSQQLGVPLNTTNVYRTRNNESQTQKSLAERIENVKNIFELRDSTLFANKTILLIDDVITTGSTIIACCKALQNSPNIKIHIYTAAAADVI